MIFPRKFEEWADVGATTTHSVIAIEQSSAHVSRSCLIKINTRVRQIGRERPARPAGEVSLSTEHQAVSAANGREITGMADQLFICWDVGEIASKLLIGQRCWFVRHASPRPL